MSWIDWDTVEVSSSLDTVLRKQTQSLLGDILFSEKLFPLPRLFPVPFVCLAWGLHKNYRTEFLRTQWKDGGGFKEEAIKCWIQIKGIKDAGHPDPYFWLSDPFRHSIPFVHCIMGVYGHASSYLGFCSSAGMLMPSMSSSLVLAC